MKVGIVVLLVCQVFLPSTDAAHHEFQDLGATAGTFFADINVPVPEKTIMVMAKPTNTIAPVRPNSQEIQSESRPKNQQSKGVTSMPPVVSSKDIFLEDDEVMTHISDQHTTPQPSGQSTSHMTHIKTSPVPKLNANTVMLTKVKTMKISNGPQNVKPIQYSYNKPTTGDGPQMVMRMSSNVYKPQMNNRHYGTGRKQYSTNGYGKRQNHYYHSLNNL
jgi:hypothetical protein